MNFIDIALEEITNGEDFVQAMADIYMVSWIPTQALLQRQAPGLSRISLPMHYFR